MRHVLSGGAARERARRPRRGWGRGGTRSAAARRAAPAPRGAALAAGAPPCQGPAGVWEEHAGKVRAPLARAPRLGISSTNARAPARRRELARRLQWPLIDKDDARDCFEPYAAAAAAAKAAAAAAAAAASAHTPARESSSSPARAAAAAAPAAAGPGHAPPAPAAGCATIDWNELAYAVMFKVAGSQLSAGLCAVVECPFARAQLYERARQLAQEARARLRAWRRVVLACAALPATGRGCRRPINGMGGLGPAWGEQGARMPRAPRTCFVLAAPDACAAATPRSTAPR